MKTKAVKKTVIKTEHKIILICRVRGISNSQKNLAGTKRTDGRNA